ncbi:528_t:CDS:2 [Entrophospora sp. SA101]|nr:528_t:CDS:2 [Entrophospora sp. SA101]
MNQKKNKAFETLTKSIFGIPMYMRACGGGNEKVMALWLFEQCSFGVTANESLDPQEAK